MPLVREMYMHDKSSYDDCESNFNSTCYIMRSNYERLIQILNMYSFEQFDKEIIFLLKSGIDINRLDDNDESILYKICCAKNPKIKLIKEYINVGADVNFCDTYGNTIIMHILMETRRKKQNISVKNINVIKYLIAAGVNVNLFNKKGNNPFTYIIEKSIFSLSHKNYLDLLNILLDAGTDVNFINDIGNNILSQIFTRTDLDME